MLTTHANNPIEDASNATNTLLATNTPGYTGGMLAAEQGRGDVSSRVGSRATGYDCMAPGSFADLDERKRQADEADPLKPGMWGAEGRKGNYVDDWTDIMDRAGAKYG